MLNAKLMVRSAKKFSFWYARQMRAVSKYIVVKNKMLKLTLGLGISQTQINKITGHRYELHARPLGGHGWVFVAREWSASKGGTRTLLREKTVCGNKPIEVGYHNIIHSSTVIDEGIERVEKYRFNIESNSLISV